MFKFASIVGLGLGLNFASALHADTVTFQSIPGALSANDMSADGRFVVGEKIVGGTYRFDTITQQMLTLPAAAVSAVAVSDDGNTVLGDIIDPGTNSEVAAIWKSSTNVWQSLGYLPNAQSCPSRSNGYELSADGSVAVGLSWDGCNGRGFRWTQGTGMVELQPLANGGNRASACSADGNLIGGFAQGSFDRTPAIWNANASGQILDPPNGDAQGEVFGINDAGSIILGSWYQKATMWTFPGLVRTQIGGGAILPGWTGMAMDIANDGTVVGFDFLAGNRRAWIQIAGTGPLIDLKTWVQANGGVVPSGTILEVCQAISADRRKIIGHSFGTGAWLITTNPTSACAADIAPPGGDGVINVADLLAVINQWGPCPVPPAACSADCAPTGGDGQVNVGDLLAVINHWGACTNVLGACCTGNSCSQLTNADCAAIGGTFLGNNVPCSPTACINNDHCIDAADITANINGPTVLGDNSTATPPFGGGDTELPLGSPSCQWAGDPSSAHSTVWYSFIAPANGSVTIATCASVPPFSDSTLALFEGSCGSLTQIGCDEDGCGDYFSRLIATRLTPGETYRLCVMNPGDWTGSVPGPFSLTITSP